mmetsp:Transcript_66713/g.135287  ORF Transcript_66713/g.135287 Transcript_66713/m.135287 type:complete len:408 (+) Transcript_66713:403-1626(+)
MPPHRPCHPRRASGVTPGVRVLLLLARCLPRLRQCLQQRAHACADRALTAARAALLALELLAALVLAGEVGCAATDGVETHADVHAGLQAHGAVQALHGAVALVQLAAGLEHVAAGGANRRARQVVPARLLRVLLRLDLVHQPLQRGGGQHRRVHVDEEALGALVLPRHKWRPPWRQRTVTLAVGRSPRALRLHLGLHAGAGAGGPGLAAGHAVAVLCLILCLVVVHHVRRSLAPAHRWLGRALGLGCRGVDGARRGRRAEPVDVVEATTALHEHIVVRIRWARVRLAWHDRWLGHGGVRRRGCEAWVDTALPRLGSDGEVRKGRRRHWGGSRGATAGAGAHGVHVIEHVRRHQVRRLRHAVPFRAAEKLGALRRLLEGWERAQAGGLHRVEEGTRRGVPRGERAVR